MQEDNMRVANEWVKNIDDISSTSKSPLISVVINRSILLMFLDNGVHVISTMTLPKGYKSKVNKKEKEESTSSSITSKENNNINTERDIKVTSATADDYINKQENKIVTDNISPNQEVTVDDITVEDEAVITAVTTTPASEGEVRSETELRMPLQENEKEVRSETELKVMSSPLPPSPSLAAEGESSATTLSSESIEDYPYTKNVEEKVKIQNTADNSGVVMLDETKANIKRSMDEARSQIPQYARVINESREQTIQAAMEIADNYLESQKEIINSLQSLWAPFAENIYKTNYAWWISPRRMTEIYSKMVSNFVDNVITATRLVNKTVFANMDAFKTSMQQAKDNTKDLSRMAVHAARTFEQTSNNSNDNKTGDPEQIPKEDVQGEIEKIISEQGGVEGQRKEVNVESYSKTASLGQILKDLDFPTTKDKIVKFVQQQKNANGDLLSIMQRIEDK
jgi:soluble cytochrome b562